MLKTLTLQEEAVPVLKSGLEMKRHALEFSLQQYEDRLRAFEKRFQIPTLEFRSKFQSGMMGDNPDWFEWEYVLDALEETEQQLKLLESVKI